MSKMKTTSLLPVCAVVAILHFAAAIRVTEHNDVVNDVNIENDSGDLDDENKPTDFSSKTGLKPEISSVDESDTRGSDLEPQGSTLDPHGSDLDPRGGDLDPRGDERESQAGSAGWGRHQQPWKTSLFGWMKYPPSPTRGRDPSRGSKRHQKMRQARKARRLAARARGRRRKQRPSNVQRERTTPNRAPDEPTTQQHLNLRENARDNNENYNQQQPGRQQQQQHHHHPHQSPSSPTKRHSSSPPPPRPDDHDEELEGGNVEDVRHPGSSARPLLQHKGLRNLRQSPPESRYRSSGIDGRDSASDSQRLQEYVGQGMDDVHNVLSSGASPRRQSQRRGRRHQHDVRTAGYGRHQTGHHPHSRGREPQSSSCTNHQQDSCRQAELENRELKITYRTNMEFLKRLLADVLDRVIADPSQTLTYAALCEASGETSSPQRRRHDVTRPGEVFQQPASEIPLILSGSRPSGRRQRPAEPSFITSQGRSGTQLANADESGSDAEGDDAFSVLRHLFETDEDLRGRNAGASDRPNNPHSSVSQYRATPPFGLPGSPPENLRNQHEHHRRTLGGSASGRSGRKNQHARAYPDPSRRVGSRAVPRARAAEDETAYRPGTDANSPMGAEAISGLGPPGTLLHAGTNHFTAHPGGSGDPRRGTTGGVLRGRTPPVSRGSTEAEVPRETGNGGDTSGVGIINVAPREDSRRVTRIDYNVRPRGVVVIEDNPSAGTDSVSRVGTNTVPRVGTDGASHVGTDSVSRVGLDGLSRTDPRGLSRVGAAQNSGQPAKDGSSPRRAMIVDTAHDEVGHEDDHGDPEGDGDDDDDDDESDLEAGSLVEEPGKRLQEGWKRKKVAGRTATDDGADVSTEVEACQLGPWTDWSGPVGFGVIERRRYPVAEDEDCQVPSEEDELVMRVDIFVFNDTHTYYKAPEKVGEDFEADFTRRSHVPRDLLLVLDASGSIEPEDFELMRDGVDVMVRLFCGGFGRGEANNRLAILIFGSRMHIVHRFSDDQSPDTLRDVIANMTQPNGNTCTGDALTMAKDVIFSPENGARPSVAHDTLLVTDGHSNCGEVTIREGARTLRGVSKVWALGVGLADDPEARGELNSVVSDSDPRHIFSLARFQDFKTMLDSIQKRHRANALPCLPIVEDAALASESSSSAAAATGRVE